MTNLAAMIIDMQNHFVNKMSEDKKNSLINSQMEIIDYCAENKIPLFNIAYVGLGFSGAFINEIKNKIRVYEKKSRMKVHTRGKYSDSAFDSLLVYRDINELKPKKLIITGINAFACVQASVLDASHYCEVHVADNLIGSSKEDSFYNFPLFERETKLKEAYFDSYGNCKEGKLENIFYHENHKKFIEYLEKN